MSLDSSETSSTHPLSSKCQWSVTKSLKLLFYKVSKIKMSPCVAVCCSVLQRVAACCSVTMSLKWLSHKVSKITKSPCVAVCCSVLQCVAACCSVTMSLKWPSTKSVKSQCLPVLQRVAAFCSVTMSLKWLFHKVSRITMSPCVAVCCSVLQRLAV